MSFWEQQSRARKRTQYYLLIFGLITIGMSALLEYMMRTLAQEAYHPPYPLFGLSFILITFLVAGFHYSMYQNYGGGYVAKSVGARLVLHDSPNPQVQQLVNIVEEMALASSMPLPEVYVLDVDQINAFAAGLTPQKAAIAVTQGALKNLTRAELQGVIAHEFGHIANGDMKINMRLAAMIMGFVFILYMALRILQFSSYGGFKNPSNQKGGNPIVLAAFCLLIAGTVTWFCGALLRSLVSRQREYLADASSVQFTRQPEALASALTKIANAQNPEPMPATGMAISHMYFDNHSFWTSLFATHPPLKKRIAAILKA